MMREFKFMLRDRAVLVWLSLALAFSATAVVMGLGAVNQQHAEIAELQRLDQKEREITLSEHSDWGSVAYYTFYVTYDPPSDFAYAALGHRDALSLIHI